MIDRRGFLAAAASAAVAALGGCALAPAPPPFRLMVPNPPGGGYDVTARTVAATLDEAGLVPDVEVFNLPGSAGTAALARLVYEEGNAGLLLQMGLGMVARTHLTADAAPVTRTTPLARLLEEPIVLLVPPESPFRAFADLCAAWEAADAPLRVGGGSSSGGPDHLALMLLAERLGLPGGATEYVWHDGGGETLAALLDRSVDVAASGAGEYRHAIAAGELRPLAVTGERRVPGVDAPTLRELGIDLAFVNWRGLLAPPGIGAADRSRLIATLTELRSTPQWQAALADNHWSDAFLTGGDFGAFLAAEDRRVERLLARLDVGGG
ncbi:Bug family tripartite tricarboxylate transporter substrate binding protein [Nocardiopsis trehalosi]|uniref:Bug family tripartite tricarboxylate transporter substrate binding protein n=1 Tax=Nocardiopsis trehalosi TaxID=109329 RepID=UPI00082FD4ED|nr:tripartite tricarboxylate transporter substrate binding protein [Nocardiopsis trehalosi]